MFLIADGGISTKNTLVNTKGAISLSLNTSFISGISLNVAYTKDEVFIIADRDSLMFTTQGSGYMQNNTYNDLLHFNIGTKVLNARVVTLNEVLEIYNNTDKMLVLNLDYQGERTEQYTYQLLALISNYPNINIFLKSFDETILSILKNSNTKAKIGIIISDNNLEELNNNYNFYVINSYLVSKDNLISKINNNKLIMTELINNGGELINYYYRYGEFILNNLYIISDNPTNLNKEIKLLGK
jgi:glycerophosphoryl diester phosphodiesterase